MIEDRFKDVFSQVEIELAQSFPVINENCEILFFYSTSENDEFSYIVNDVEHVFSRNIFSGEIKKLDLSQTESEKMNKCKGEIIRPLLIDDEAYDAEDDYYEGYELIYEAILKNKVAEKSAVTELLSIFEKLVPDSNLKEFYKEIGKQLFELA